jgi:ubiquinol-cytochrome c reductase cytochrome b subunit
MGWLNRRTGVDDLLRSALYEPIPGGARFAYIFGSGLLFIFISQVITGIFLALYYVPSADHAHTTVAYITKAVTAGSFLRSLHALRGQRDGHRSVPTPIANLHLRVVQRTA